MKMENNREGQSKKHHLNPTSRGLPRYDKNRQGPTGTDGNAPVT
jgi:hypothetical protein